MLTHGCKSTSTWIKTQGTERCSQEPHTLRKKFNHSKPACLDFIKSELLLNLRKVYKVVCQRQRLEIGG